MSSWQHGLIGGQAQGNIIFATSYYTPRQEVPPLTILIDGLTSGIDIYNLWLFQVIINVHASPKILAWLDFNNLGQPQCHESVKRPLFAPARIPHHGGVLLQNHIGMS